MLRSVDAILAEDTRHSRRLLERYGISTRLVSYHEHNEAKTTASIVSRLVGGESFALISDAGTPLISDPGERLVSAAVAAGIRVVPVPGASAALAAIAASGLPIVPFTFFGFLPRAGAARRSMIARIAATTHSCVLYESPNRVAATLQEFAALSPAREAVVARELTKIHEEFRRGPLEELAAHYAAVPARGEVVIVLGPAQPEPDSTTSIEQARAIAGRMRAEGATAKDVVAALTAQHGMSRNEAYRIAHE